MMERRPSPRVERFFRKLGFSELPKMRYVSRERIEEVCGPGTLGCIKRGRIYVRSDLPFPDMEATVAHELAHKLLNVREVGAFLTQYFFLRGLSVKEQLKPVVLISSLLGPFQPLYTSERGAIRPWESLWVSYRLRGRNLPKDVFKGRNPEGLVYLLSKVAKLDYRESLPHIYDAIKTLYEAHFREPGSFAYTLLEGSRRLQEEEKERLVKLLEDLIDHIEGMYGDSFDLSEREHLKDAHLAAEIRAFLRFLGRDIKKGSSPFSTVASFYEGSVISTVLSKLTKPEVSRRILRILTS